MATVTLGKDNLDSTVDKPGIVLIDFWADWCEPCKAFAPIFESVSSQHPDVVFGKVDTEAEEELAAGFQIRAIPTLLAFRDGIIVLSHSGLVPPEALNDLVGKIRALDMEDVKRQIAEAEAEAPKPEDFEA